MTCGENCNCGENGKLENGKKHTLTNLKKWEYTLYTTLVAFLVFNSITYSTLNTLINGICDSKGCPTNLGFILHLIVFTFLIRMLM
jgi:hypothetical protein|tara:strand:- start:216 stop:473 length:258 start_codon:yes stop_codon:yes gene_type:complete